MEFCTLNELVIANTQFKQSKPSRCWTWQSPNGVDQNQIDYIMVSRKLRGSLRNCRAYPSADVGSDHQLVMANLKLKLKRNHKRSAASKADILKLTDDTVRKNYQIDIENQWAKLINKRRSHDTTTVDEDWSDMRSVMHAAADKTLGRIKGVARPDWISLQTLKLAEE